MHIKRGLLINKIIYQFTLFFLIIGVFLQPLIGIGIIDELSVILIFFFSCFIRGKRLISNAEFLSFSAIYIFYLTYSLITRNNPSIIGILLDSFQQIKPFLLFYSILILNTTFTEKQKLKLKKTVIFLATTAFLLILISRNNYFFFNHPAYYSNVIVNLTLIYIFCTDHFKFKDKVIISIIICFGILGFRSKLYGEALLIIFILFKITDFIKINFKTILITIILLTLCIIITWEKFQIYFMQGMDEDNGIARTILYLKSPLLLVDYFPFGPGFCTYASWFSGEYYSPLYNKYNLNEIHGITPDFFEFIADTYYPQLTQFGIVGILLFILFWKRRYNYYKQCTIKYTDINYYKFFLYIVSFIGIECIASPCLQTNLGLLPMLLLALKEKTHYIKL